MQPTRLSRMLILCSAVVFVAICQTAVAGTLCVNPAGSHNCFKSIQTAVNHAAANDLIQIEAGTYSEEVVIGLPVAIIGAGASASIIDATGLAHGIFVDGFDHPGLKQVTITGLTVKNADFEGVLVVSASDVTIQDNRVINNDATPGLEFTGGATGCPNQPGNGVYENDETGDCGGAVHLIGTANSIVSGNFITGNADGVLISDETSESHDNLLIHNTITNNPLECGIVLASHPPTGKTSPPFGPHFGVDHNTVAENISNDNGVKIGGSGAGMFSDGMGRGRVSDNVIIGNTLIHNGLGGVALHTHVGPAFGLPADDMSGNKIILNTIAGNLADQDDTATPGRVGININSGGGGSPVRGTVISQNVISNEDIDIAVNTPAEVDIHLNSLLGSGIGVGDVCAFDGATVCTGTIDATENYWGCPAGPDEHGCTTFSAARILWIPWLRKPVGSH